MKKVLAIISILATFVFISCESTKQESDLDGQDSTATYENADKKSSSSGTSSYSSKSQYKKLLQDVKITVLSFPKETVKGKAFSTPYKIQATNEQGAALPSLKITAEYPVSRNGESFNYAKAELETDQNGIAEFNAPAPDLAANANVLFYPQTPSSDPDLVRMATSAAVEAQWKSRSNLGSHTGILVSIVDYRQNGNINVGNGAQPSAQALTSNLWRSKLMGAQNADFRHSVDADDPVRIRQDALKQLNGNTLFKFVVYGRVKYASPITQDADGYFTVNLNGDLGALNISSGDVLLKCAKSVSVKEKSEWKAISTAQQEMAKLFCEELIYALYN